MVHFVENSFKPGSSVEPPPLVFIHGAGCDHRVWPEALHHYQGGKVYLVDLPGHGKSPSQNTVSIDAYSNTVVSFLQNRGIQKAIICGHSMGGAVALSLATRRPELICELILVSTGAHLPVSSQILSLAKRIDLQPVVLDWTLKMGFFKGTPEAILEKARAMLIEIPAEMFHKDLSACNCFDLRDEVESITSPTLIICGTKDRMTPMKFSQELHSHIRGSQLEVVEGAGHFLPMEVEGIFTEILSKWLKQRNLKLR